MTAGDQLDVLVAMNPAALITNLADVKPGGIVIIDKGAFSERNLAKAGYAANPLGDDSLSVYRVVEIDISRLNVEAGQPFGFSNKEALPPMDRLGLGPVSWLYDRKRAPDVGGTRAKFADHPYFH